MQRGKEKADVGLTVSSLWEDDVSFLEVAAGTKQSKTPNHRYQSLNGLFFLPDTGT